MTCEEIRNDINGFTEIDISLKTKTTEYVEYRYTYYHLCLKYASDAGSYAKIGRMVKRDHSTVIIGLRKCIDFLQSDKEFAKKYKRIESLILENVPIIVKREILQVDSFSVMKLKRRYMKSMKLSESRRQKLKTAKNRIYFLEKQIEKISK